MFATDILLFFFFFTILLFTHRDASVLHSLQVNPNDVE